MSSSFFMAGKLKYEYEIDTGRLTPCPGFYCGRTLFSNGTYSNCGACPRGFRKNDTTFACEPCNQELPFYDLLYLGFMALLPIILHFITSDSKRLKSAKITLGHIFCILFEVLLAAFVTIFIWSDDPWNFSIKSCGVNHLSDWYPFLYNPSPNYEETLYCSYEVVYPLYTMILIFYTLADLFMIFIRIIAYFLGIRLMKSIYSGLYFYPILAFFHLILCGVIYRIFPLITIIASVVSIAYHFATRRNQKMKSLVIETFTDWKNFLIVFCHCILHAYGIISITQMENITRDSALLALVPMPSILYIVTVPFTSPNIGN